MMLERARRRISGQASVDRYVETGHRLALSAQEVIAVSALLGFGLALVMPFGGFGDGSRFVRALNAYGGDELLGSVVLSVAVPQAVMLIAAFTGFVDLNFAHDARVAMLTLTAGLFTLIAGVWIADGAIWAGGLYSVIFAASAAAAARHVHLYNGGTVAGVRLPPEVSELLSRRDA